MATRNHESDDRVRPRPPQWGVEPQSAEERCGQQLLLVAAGSLGVAGIAGMGSNPMPLALG